MLKFKTPEQYDKWLQEARDANPFDKPEKVVIESTPEHTTPLVDMLYEWMENIEKR